jgi:prepilin-type processing-associated H-X9-DG protein
MNCGKNGFRSASARRSVFIVVALLVSVFLSWMLVFKPFRPERPCYRKLWHIGNVLMVYQIDHNGILPNTLDSLVATGDLKESDLSCGKLKYCYFAGGRKFNDISSNEIIAADPPGAHQEGGNVLFGDGHTAWLDRLDFQKVGVPATQP